MAISKATVAAGVVGGGSGVVITGTAIKYVTSKSETAQEKSSSTNTGVSVENSASRDTQRQPESSENVGNEQTNKLTQAKTDLDGWIAQHKGCSVKTQQSEGSPTDAKSITNAEDLEKLVKYLKETGKTEAEKICKPTSDDSSETSAELILEKKNDAWTIKNSTSAG